MKTEFGKIPELPKERFDGPATISRCPTYGMKVPFRVWLSWSSAQ